MKIRRWKGEEVDAERMICMNVYGVSCFASNKDYFRHG